MYNMVYVSNIICFVSYHIAGSIMVTQNTPLIVNDKSSQMLFFLESNIELIKLTQ